MILLYADFYTAYKTFVGQSKVSVFHQVLKTAKGILLAGTRQERRTESKLPQMRQSQIGTKEQKNKKKGRSGDVYGIGDKKDKEKCRRICLTAPMIYNVSRPDAEKGVYFS